MATSRGGPAVRQFMAQVPAKLQTSILRGAGRAGANVVAAEARERVTSDDTRKDIVITVQADGSRVVSKVTVTPGWGRSVGIWLEYGTDPHFIRVDPAHRQGMSVKRINLLDKVAAKEGRSGPGASLEIGGRFVGTTVHHPGARPHPFLRVSLDAKEGDAVLAAQRYIDARVSRRGIVADGDAEGDDV